MKIQFPYSIRVAMGVADLVARAVRPELCPSLLSIRGKSNLPVFHYELGTVVQVEMFDLDILTETWRMPHRQDWVITGVGVRYRRGGSGHKTEEFWGVTKLSQLRDGLPLRDPQDIKGRVVILYDNASGEGGVRVDPDYNYEGHMTLSDELEYRVLVPGDREKVVAEAKDRLAKY